MPKLNQRGVVHFLLPLILLLGIIAGVWLITNGNPLKLFSKATNPPIVFKSSTGTVLPNNSSGVPTSVSATVKIEFTSTLGPPVGGVSSPVSGPASSTTRSYKFAENPTDLNTASYQSYVSEPTVVDYTFQNSSPGQKFIWVEFLSSDSRTDRRSGQIEIVTNSVSGPINSPSSAPTSLPTPTSTPVATHKISGQIIATVNGKLTPLLNNGVTAKNTRTGKVYSTKTGFNGTYSLSNLPNDSYLITPTRHSTPVLFTPQNKTIRVNGQNVSNVNFSYQVNYNR